MFPVATIFFLNSILLAISTDKLMETHVIEVHFKTINSLMFCKLVGHWMNKARQSKSTFH